MVSRELNLELMTISNGVDNPPNTLAYFCMRNTMYDCNVIRPAPGKITKGSTQSSRRGNEPIFGTIAMPLLGTLLRPHPTTDVFV